MQGKLVSIAAADALSRLQKLQLLLALLIKIW